MPNSAKHTQNSFSGRLLSWYEQNKRDLPWRNSNDPYVIWISEIMLQQTQVATVEPYFHRFLERFPDVTSLANANLDDVLKAWEGLGYYSRARNLHKGARKVLEVFDGSLPKTREELLGIPGIGPYTAGAIASIAFGEPEIVVDGNVRRAMARVLKITEDPKLPAVQRNIESCLRRRLPLNHAGDFNQALMELGAVICTPVNPQCARCPVESVCEARKQGLVSELPVRTPRKPRPHYNVAIGIVWRDERVLITKRPEEKLLGGLWEFPGGKQQKDESIEACLEREMAEELSIEIDIERALPVVDHGYTHFTVTLHPFECRWLSGEPTLNESTDLAWIELSQLDNYAFPRGNRKILDNLFEGELNS